MAAALQPVAENTKLEGVTLRGEKGMPLTHSEMDLNFIIMKIIGRDKAEDVNAFVNRDSLPLLRDGANSSGWYRVSQDDVGNEIQVGYDVLISEFLDENGDVAEYAENGGEGGRFLVFDRPGIVKVQLQEAY